jgi:ribosomal protein L11 methyltransferase
VSYLQLRFLIQRDRAGELSEILETAGALSVTWENAGEDAYFEVAWPREPDWRMVHVTGLFDENCEPESVANRVNTHLGEQLIPQIKPLEEQDWERAWLTQFEPRRYRGDLWVCPSWIEPPDPRATNIIIDPGLAFGTGDHATTALCLDWISGHDRWSGCTVMDYGCGSGILAIACLLKGAAHATGVDVDPRAVSTSALNAARNGVADRFEALLPGDLPENTEYDLVVANILSSVLLEHSATLRRAVRPGGTLLLTGILEDHADRVSAAYEPAFSFETERRDGWCLLIGVKRRTSAG